MMLMIVVIMRLYHGTCSSVDNEDEFLKPIHTLKESMPFCLPVPQLSDSCLAAGSRTLSLGSMLSQGVKRGRASSGVHGCPPLHCEREREGERERERCLCIHKLDPD
jgi:hypothetical protein